MSQGAASSEALDNVMLVSNNYRQHTTGQYSHSSSSAVRNHAGCCDSYMWSASFFEHMFFLCSVPSTRIIVGISKRRLVN